MLRCIVGDERASAGRLFLAGVDGGDTDVLTLGGPARRKLAHRDAGNRQGLPAVRAAAFDFLAPRARAGEVRLFGRDPASAAEIAALPDRGGAVAELPTTVEARRRPGTGACRW